MTRAVTRQRLLARIRATAQLLCYRGMQLIVKHRPCIAEGVSNSLVWITRAVTRECPPKIDKVSRAL